MTNKQRTVIRSLFYNSIRFNQEITYSMTCHHCLANYYPLTL